MRVLVTRRGGAATALIGLALAAAAIFAIPPHAHALSGTCGPVAAPSVAAEPVNVMWPKSIQVGALTRTYYVYRPATTIGCVVPLVIVLHGINTSVQQFEQVTLFDEWAAQNGFIAIFPESAEPDYSWNTKTCGGCFGLAAKLKIDDVGFVNAVVDQAKSDYSIDPSRVFVTGHSNGGFLAYGLACFDSQRFAAIGVVGAYPDYDCHPSHTVSVLHIHGDADPIVPYPGLVYGGLYMWDQLDGCSGPTQAYSGPVDHFVFGEDGCSSLSGVELYVVHGMGHLWPAPWNADSSAKQMNATATIWQFFADHARYGG